MLDAELRTCMGLLGVRTVAELREHGGDLVRRRHPSFRDAQGARYAPGGLC
jgi:isopentenyl diphosphate isomerase/L-lactate dehydrogenase-like FMN-dependent dehydrogenase